MVRRRIPRPTFHRRRAGTPISIAPATKARIPPSTPEGVRRDAVVGSETACGAVVDTDKVAVALPLPLIAAVAGTEQVISTVVFETAQLKFTVPVNPFNAVMVMLVEPLCPGAAIVMLDGA